MSLARRCWPSRQPLVLARQRRLSRIAACARPRRPTFRKARMGEQQTSVLGVEYCLARKCLLALTVLGTQVFNHSCVTHQMHQQRPQIGNIQHSGPAHSRRSSSRSGGFPGSCRPTWSSSRSRRARRRGAKRRRRSCAGTSIRRPRTTTPWPHLHSMTGARRKVHQSLSPTHQALWDVCNSDTQRLLGSNRLGNWAAQQSRYHGNPSTSSLQVTLQGFWDCTDSGQCTVWLQA